MSIVAFCYGTYSGQSFSLKRDLMLRGIEVIFYDRLFDLGYAPYFKA